MGMYLMRQASGDGLPAFELLAWTELPWYWVGTSSISLGDVPGGAGAGVAGAGVRLLRFFARGSGRVFLDHDPGLTFAGMLFFRNRPGSAAITAFAISQHPRLRYYRTQHARHLVCGHRGVAGDSLYIGWRLAAASSAGC